MIVFLVGYPGDMGGANTEAWHTIKLWRQNGIEVHLIPTWGSDPIWKARLDAIGCVTHHVHPDQIAQIEGLAGSPVIGMCNHELMVHSHRFRELGCPIVWVNCMTFFFDHEWQSFESNGLPDAFVYQSNFQRQQLETSLSEKGYFDSNGYLIRGAFDLSEWTFQPRPHARNDAYVIGRVARPDLDKWSSNTWPIYNRIQYQNKRALMLGMDERTHGKLGTAPEWADCLKPMAMPVRQYYSLLHCLLPVNGGARENWPRAGLEAMAAGVPIVTQNAWGWQEMIEHGVTGFLGDCDEELAHYAAVLAYDEELRLEIIYNANLKLQTELLNYEHLGRQWKQLFADVCNGRTVCASQGNTSA